MVELKSEFVPHDLQLRLRDQMRRLNQRDCMNLAEYISRFRKIALQVENMTELDKIIYFMDGLLSETRQEVQYMNPNSLKDAINIAMDFKRSHFDLSRRHRRPASNNTTQLPEPEPMEVDNVQARYGARRDGCWKCGRHGHTANNCRKPRRPQYLGQQTRKFQKPQYQENGNRQFNQSQTSGRTNHHARRVNAVEEVDEEKDEE
ncbi:hypothetical protein PsorP6_001132 [Peronosclerospora sorghi]|uniref:Uncharacterized protein n=1 Tax=Peronosclerospora sorghi TaxID=230839 RepID=A0ACC0WUN2_9STRA|nr:hypothetical protein PsorP6_001132 [Peronosclerospora sorghi]